MTKPWSEISSATCQTDGQGRFVLRDLPEGSLTVWVIRPREFGLFPALIRWQGELMLEESLLLGYPDRALGSVEPIQVGVAELPADLVTRLPESTEGNPLFVRELVRMLVDDRVIEEVDGRWRMVIDPGAIAVPPTVQSLLATRVERMPDDERQFLDAPASGQISSVDEHVAGG